MKNAVAIVALLVLALGTMVAASQDDGQEKKAPDKNFTGVVASVDANSGTITVEESESSQRASQMTFDVDDKTTIKKGTASVKLADISSGARVKIQYVEEGRKKLAKTIELS